jgi:hypothetical protein
MKIRTLLTGVATLALAGGILVGAGNPAFAAGTPGWEPDAAALGGLTFYDASGNTVSGGTISSHPIAAYVAANGPGRAGDSKAQLKVATPQPGVNPALWGTDTVSATTNYPSVGAPAAVASLTNPVVTGSVSDFSLDDYIGEFPNTSTTAGYQDLYEFRLFTSGPGQSQGASYYRADIQVNTAAGTWAVVFPVPATSTNTVLAANPNSPANHGAAVTLTATVTPAGTAGSVAFTEGATSLGAGSYNAATGIATITVNPADGAHTFTATFTPADPVAFNGSAGNLPYSVTPAGTPTSTVLTTSVPSPVTGDASGNANITVTANVSSTASVAGSVAFFDGATPLGNADSYTGGVATKAITLNAAGSPHLLTATFTPSTAGVQPSTSNIVSFSVLPVNFGTGSVTLNAQDNTAAFTGSLSLQVAASATVNLAQVDPTTAAGHPAQATDPTGHRHAWVFTGSLTGVSVLDTRPVESGWTVTGQATAFVNGGTSYGADHLGWSPALASGGDAEGTVNAGPSVNSILQTATSHGLANTTNLANAAPGNGLGTQNLSSGLELRIPDTSATGLYTSTLTLTLISP